MTIDIQAATNWMQKATAEPARYIKNGGRSFWLIENSATVSFESVNTIIDSNGGLLTLGIKPQDIFSVSGSEYNDSNLFEVETITDSAITVTHESRLIIDEPAGDITIIGFSRYFTPTIDLNGDSPSDAWNDREHHISQKWHHFTWVPTELDNYEPERDDEILYIGRNTKYKIDHIFPNDGLQWTVVAR